MDEFQIGKFIWIPSNVVLCGMKSPHSNSLTKILSTDKPKIGVIVGNGEDNLMTKPFVYLIIYTDNKLWSVLNSQVKLLT